MILDPRKLVGPVSAVATILALAGCASKSTTSTAAGGMSTSATPMGASAIASAAGLYSSLGGAAGVSALAESFGAKLALDPNVTRYLDDAAIGVAKGGLVNTIAALGGQSVPSGSTDLLGALSGKGLDAQALDGVTQALLNAGREQKLDPNQLSGLGSLMGPITKALSK